MKRCHLLSTCSVAIALTFATAAWADAAPTDKPASSYHNEQPSDIIVTAPFNRDRADVLAGTSVLKGSDLTRELRSTIGDTLAHQPGVSATSFGTNASRPVLRGF